jgi:hypothetical protein
VDSEPDACPLDQSGEFPDGIMIITRAGAMASCPYQEFRRTGPENDVQTQGNISPFGFLIVL